MTDEINIGDEVKVLHGEGGYKVRGMVCDICQDIYPVEWHALVTVSTATKNSYQLWVPLDRLRLIASKYWT